MYMLFRYLSSLSHASAETVELYTAPNPQSQLQVSYRRHAADPIAANLLGSASSSLLHALTAWDTTQAGRPHQESLQRAARELGVSSEWRLRTGS